MDDEDSDVQFEVEWEEVPGPQVPPAPAAAAAAGSGDIIILLNGELKQEKLHVDSSCLIVKNYAACMQYAGPCQLSCTRETAQEAEAASSKGSNGQSHEQATEHTGRHHRIASS